MFQQIANCGGIIGREVATISSRFMTSPDGRRKRYLSRTEQRSRRFECRFV